MECFSLIGQGIGQQNLTVNVVNQLAASEGLFPFKLVLVRIQIAKIIGMFLDISMGSDQKVEGAAGRVVAPLAGLGLHQSDHHINKDARSKVLVRAGLFLVGVLLQQSFIQVAQPLFPGGVPVQAVNGGNDLF